MIEIFESDPEQNRPSIIERKGIGHPDTLADGIAEFASIRYSQYCLSHFGVILHHNFDKTYIAGGLAHADFAQGHFDVKIQIHLNGRCSDQFGSEIVPVEEILRNATIHYISLVLPYLSKEDYEINVNTTTYSHSSYWYKPRTIDDVPDSIAPYANDTSYTVGYWPLKPEETILKTIESMLVECSNDVTKNLPLGQDVKLMYCGTASTRMITACIPTISSRTSNVRVYSEIIDTIRSNIMDCLSGAGLLDVQLRINTGDNRLRHESQYMLHSGTCLEGGEEGVVGRGNNHLGFIAALRPHAMEATSGKNPQYHVGKVLTRLAQACAEELHNVVKLPVEVHIVSKIGDPIRDPDYVRVVVDGPGWNSVELAHKVVRTLRHFPYCDDILNGYFLPVRSLGVQIV